MVKATGKTKATRTSAGSGSKQTSNSEDLDSVLNDSIWDLDKAYQRQLARKPSRPKNPLTYSKKQKSVPSTILPKHLTRVEDAPPSTKSARSKNILPKDITKVPTHDPSPNITSNGPAASASRQPTQKRMTRSTRKEKASNQARKANAEKEQDTETSNSKEPSSARVDINSIQHNTVQVEKPRKDKGKARAVPRVIPSSASVTKKKSLSLSKNKLSSASTPANSQSNSNNSNNANMPNVPPAGPSTKEPQQRTTSSTETPAAGSSQPTGSLFASLDDFIQDDKDLTELTLSPIRPSGDAIVRNPKFMHIEILGSTPTVSSARQKRPLDPEADETDDPRKRHRLSSPPSPTGRSGKNIDTDNASAIPFPADLPNMSLEVERSNFTLSQEELGMTVEDYLKHLVEEQVNRIKIEAEARIKQLQDTVHGIKDSIMADALTQATSQQL